MSVNKSERELAFLYDLYVAPDWGERFAELIDKHVPLPKKGRALYVAAGTGGHALSLQERGGEDLRVTGIDESEERLELARAKAEAAKMAGQADFHLSQLGTLGFSDNEFDLVVGDASLVPPERLPEILAEMVRVAVPGGQVALNVATSSSFGEFYSVYWEALCKADLSEHASMVENLINERPTVSDLETLAEGAGLDRVQSFTQKEEFDFASGEEFLNSPLVADFLLSGWLEPLPDTDEVRGRLPTQIERIIDEERGGMDFALSIKATLVVGRKAE